MDIVFHHELLHTSLEITFKGRSKVINDIIIDTGAARSIISSDLVDDLGIISQVGDKLITMFGIGGVQYAYRKKVESIKFGDFTVEGYELDFGLIDDEGKINGLLGLDLLMKMGAVLDLKKLVIYASE
jgi:predicted aspartyl protease